MKPSESSEKKVKIPGTDLTVRIDGNGYLFGREIIELVRFIPDKKYRRAADLGSGDGVIPLLAARQRRIAEIWAVELSGAGCRRATAAIDENGLAGVIRVHHGDIRKLRSVFRAHTFDLVTANPPFFRGRTDHQGISAAEKRSRREHAGGLDAFIQAAAFLLKTRGDLVILYHPTRLDDLFRELHRGMFAVKTMQFLHHRDGRALFVLVHAVPGGGRGIRCLPPITLPESIKPVLLNS